MQELRVTLQGYGAVGGARERITHAAQALGSACGVDWWLREALSFALQHGTARPISAKAHIASRIGRGSFLVPAEGVLTYDTPLVFGIQSARLPEGHAWIRVSADDDCPVQAVIQHDPSFADLNPRCQEAQTPTTGGATLHVFQLIALGVGSRCAEVREAIRRLGLLPGVDGLTA